jgi:type III pantothenate kinase
LILAIDVGNSNIAFGLFNHQLVNHWRVKTDARQTSDEYAVLFSAVLRNSQIDLGIIDQVIVSSVVPQLSGTFRSVASSLFGVNPIMVSTELDTGLTLTIDNPREIGSDLLANAVAAFYNYGGNTLVADFGTALSFVAVTTEGKIEGGVIAPGLESAIKALSTNTAQLPYVELVAPETVLGKNTVHAIQSGVLLGYAGLVEKIIREAHRELGDPFQAVATGGLVNTIAPLTNLFAHISNTHTLEGLRILAERNR